MYAFTDDEWTAIKGIAALSCSHHRLAHSLSQAEMAGILSTTQGIISRIERQDRAPMRVRIDLIHAMPDGASDGGLRARLPPLPPPDGPSLAQRIAQYVEQQQQQQQQRAETQDRISAILAARKAEALEQKRAAHIALTEQAAEASRHIRRRDRLTQWDLAAQLGTYQGTISAIERGRGVSRRVMRALVAMRGDE